MSTLKSVICFFGGFGLIWIVILAAVFAVGACLWPYTINTWLVYYDKPPCIEWWHGGLMMLIPVGGQACLPGAVITFIAMLILNG